MEIDFSRQMRVKGMTQEGHGRLETSKVLVVGAGGLATTALSYLVMSGVRHLTLCDPDKIEPSNLHRQTLYTPQDLGKNKAQTARAYLLERSPNACIDVIEQRADYDLLDCILGRFDLVLDCTDDFELSVILNQVALKHRVPVVFGNAIAMTGLLFFMDPHQEHAPCFRCVWPQGLEHQGKSDVLGILGPVAGTIGSLQAMWAIKYLTGFCSIDPHLMYYFDFRTLLTQRVNVSKRMQCPHCSVGYET